MKLFIKLILCPAQEFSDAIAMLSVLKSECHRSDLQNIPTVTKLAKLIDWEILFTQLQHMLYEWPRPCYDQQQIVQRCKQCLAAVHNASDNVVPRMDILDHCAVMLLNLNEWPALQSTDKRCPSVELCAAFAAAAMEAESMRPKKVCRDLWDLVLPMFLSKRGGQDGNGSGAGGGGGGAGGNSGSGGGGGGRQGISRDSPTMVVGNQLTPTLKRMRNVTVITVALSLLARLHNILKDDTNMELMTEYLLLWPNCISK